MHSFWSSQGKHTYKYELYCTNVDYKRLFASKTRYIRSNWPNSGRIFIKKHIEMNIECHHVKNVLTVPRIFTKIMINYVFVIFSMLNLHFIIKFVVIKSCWTNYLPLLSSINLPSCPNIFLHKYKKFSIWSHWPDENWMDQTNKKSRICNESFTG